MPTMPRLLTYFFTIALAIATLPKIVFASVVINEIAWMGTQTSTNDEWIELFNNTTISIDIGDWLLKTADNKLKIDLSGKIPNQGFFLLERTDDQTVPDISADIIYTGGLNNQGESLQLVDNQGKIIDEINCDSGWPAENSANIQAGWFSGNNTTKQTMSRRQEQESGNNPANWCDSAIAGGTPKSQNQCLDVAAPSIDGDGVGTGISPSPPRPITYPANIYVNEIMPSPEGSDAENEWIELFNANDFEVDLSGWQIKDGIGAVRTYAFPADTKIGPTGFLVLSRVQTKITLQNNGDSLELINPSTTTVDKVEYGNAGQGQSYNKTPSGYLWSSNFTPGKENNVSRTNPEAQQISNGAGKFGAGQTTAKNQPATNNNQPLTADISGQTRASSQVNNKNNIKNVLIFFSAIAIAGISALIVWLLRKNNKENPENF